MSCTYEGVSRGWRGWPESPPIFFGGCRFRRVVSSLGMEIPTPPPKLTPSRLSVWNKHCCFRREDAFNADAPRGVRGLSDVRVIGPYIRATPSRPIRCVTRPPMPVTGRARLSAGSLHQQAPARGLSVLCVLVQVHTRYCVPADGRRTALIGQSGQSGCAGILLVSDCAPKVCVEKHDNRVKKELKLKESGKLLIHNDLHTKKRVDFQLFNGIL